MFENSTHLHFRAETFDKAVLTVRAFIVPVIRKQPGLLSLALIPDPATGRLTILSLWKSRDNARAIEVVREYREAIRELDPFLLKEGSEPNSKPFTHLKPEIAFSLN